MQDGDEHKNNEIYHKATNHKASQGPPHSFVTPSFDHHRLGIPAHRTVVRGSTVGPVLGAGIFRSAGVTHDGVHGKAQAATGVGDQCLRRRITNSMRRELLGGGHRKSEAIATSLVVRSYSDRSCEAVERIVCPKCSSCFPCSRRPVDRRFPCPAVRAPSAPPSFPRLWCPIHGCSGIGCLLINPGFVDFRTSHQAKLAHKALGLVGIASAQGARRKTES